MLECNGKIDHTLCRFFIISKHTIPIFIKSTSGNTHLFTGWRKTAFRLFSNRTLHLQYLPKNFGQYSSIHNNISCSFVHAFLERLSTNSDFLSAALLPSSHFIKTSPLCNVYNLHNCQFTVCLKLLTRPYLKNSCISYSFITITQFCIFVKLSTGFSKIFSKNQTTY